MKKYIVRCVSVATKENPCFRGYKCISYHGKGDRVIDLKEGLIGLTEDPLKNICSYFIEEYGYNRICDAKKCYTYKNPENTKYWKSRNEIIEVTY